MEKESDVTVISDSKTAISRAEKCFYFHRKNLERYVEKDTQFLTSFSPVKVNTDFEIINYSVQ